MNNLLPFQEMEPCFRGFSFHFLFPPFVHLSLGPVPAEREQTRTLSWPSPVCLWAWGLASRKLSKVHSHAQCGNPTRKPHPWTLHSSFSAKAAIDEMSSGRPGDEGQLFSVVRDVLVGFLYIFMIIKKHMKHLCPTSPTHPGGSL